MNDKLVTGLKFSNGNGNGNGHGSKSAVLDLEEMTRRNSSDEVSLPPPMSIPAPAALKPAVIETIRRGEFTVFETYERWDGGLQDFLVWLARHELFVLPDRDRVINGGESVKIYRVIVDGRDEVVRDGVHRCRHYIVADRTSMTLVLGEHREE